jgi:hypothetical protein
MDALNEGDKLWVEALAATYEFSEACAKLNGSNSRPEINPLNQLITTLMAELWEKRFSQSEIRDAFQIALVEMNCYADGKERRA